MQCMLNLVSLEPYTIYYCSFVNNMTEMIGKLYLLL